MAVDTAEGDIEYNAMDDRRERAFIRLRGATERMLIILQYRSDRHYEIALQAIETAMAEYRAAAA